MSEPNPISIDAEGAGAPLTETIPSAFEQKDQSLFDAIASNYARKDTLPASRLARRQRLIQSLKLIDLPKQASLLELGCGAGWSASYLEGQYHRFVGIDYSGELVDYARRTHQIPGVEFRVGNIKHMTAEEQFDVVCMIGVIHHVDNIQEAMAVASSLARPGGWVVANEPQSGNPLIQVARRLRKAVDRAYSDDQITMSRSMLSRCFSDAGLVDVRVIPQGYLSTPFAEVPLPMQRIATWLSAAACQGDRILESILPSWLPLSWNLVAAGRRPSR